ncbi:hypothetical protein KY385_03770 [Candidatus Parcubacteria bacterium]|nr:hypothetical protein [Candidatus Parcubacteria bacterium]
MRKRLGKIPVLVLALHLMVAPALYFQPKALAENLTNRSITIGSSRPSVTTSHKLDFTIPTAGPLGSIDFEYCSNNPFIGTACTAPNGLDVSGAAIDNQSGETGFAIDPSTTANRLLITRIPAPNLASQPASYDFSNIVNPTADAPSIFVRISTFATDDGTGPRTDSGAVVFAITRGLSVEAFVPPYLTFCVGITISGNCASMSGSFINLGEFSKTSANYSTSQFAGATNDPGGYSVFMAGNTMASGTNIIPALTALQASKPGTSQFGINLVANSNPAVGQNRIGSGTVSALPGYKTPNLFKFKNEPIAASSLPTNYNTLTVSYLVNVSNSQKPGVYSSTITYIATAAF